MHKIKYRKHRRISGTFLPENFAQHRGCGLSARTSGKKICNFPWIIPKHQNKVKNGTTLSSRTCVVNGPLFLRCWQLWWQICQSNYRTPFHRRVCHRWMASKYPCKPAWKPRTAKEIAKICFVDWTKRQHLSPVFSLLIECLATKPRYATERRTNLLINFRTWIALTGKMLGKSSSGKAVLCSSTFSYLFRTC